MHSGYDRAIKLPGRSSAAPLNDQSTISSELQLETQAGCLCMNSNMVKREIIYENF
jgi:hypothetical protein